MFEEPIYGYDQLKPVSGIQIVKGINATVMDVNGVCRKIKIEKAAFGPTVQQNLIPLRLLLQNKEDLVIFNKDGGIVVSASWVEVKKESGTKITPIEFMNGSYWMKVNLDANKLEEFYQMTRTERESVMKQWKASK